MCRFLPPTPACPARCFAGATATATALIPALGYAGAAEVVAVARATGRTVRDVAVSEGRLTADAFDALVGPEAVRRLGMPDAPGGKGR